MATYEIDEQSYRGQMRCSLAGNQSTQAGSEEGPKHIGKGKQQERTAAKSVNCPNSREGEEEVDQAETKGRIESLGVTVTGPGEDSRAIEGNNVDWQRVSGVQRRRRQGETDFHIVAARTSP